MLIYHDHLYLHQIGDYADNRDFDSILYILSMLPLQALYLDSCYGFYWKPDTETGQFYNWRDGKSDSSTNSNSESEEVS